MRQRTIRRGLAVGAGAAAAALTFTSAAYACTTISGRLAVTGAGGSQSVAVGDVSTAHKQCTDKTIGGAQAAQGGSITIDVGPYVNTSSLFTNDSCPSSGYAPSADAPGGPTWVRNPECWAGDVPIPTCSQIGGMGYHRLEGKGVGTYEARIVSGKAFSVSGTTYTHAFPPSTDTECFEGATGDWNVIGTFTVGQNGIGTHTTSVPRTLADSGPSETGGVCIYAERAQVDSPPPDPNDPFSSLYANYWVDSNLKQFTNMAPLLIV